MCPFRLNDAGLYERVFIVSFDTSHDYDLNVMPTQMDGTVRRIVRFEPRTTDGRTSSVTYSDTELHVGSMFPTDE